MKTGVTVSAAHSVRSEYFWRSNSDMDGKASMSNAVVVVAEDLDGADCQSSVPVVSVRQWLVSLFLPECLDKACLAAFIRC